MCGQGGQALYGAMKGRPTLSPTHQTVKQSTALNSKATQHAMLWAGVDMFAPSCCFLNQHITILSGCVSTCSLAKESAAFPLILPVLVRVKLKLLLKHYVGP